MVTDKMYDSRTKNSIENSRKYSNVVERQYSGSYICLASSHLFLFAAITNYNCGNCFESFIIFLLYLSSINYHAVPTKINKDIDVFVVKSDFLMCSFVSVWNYNILPPIQCLVAIYMYYLEYTKFKFEANSIKSNIYHATCVHFITFLGLMML